MSIDAEPRDLTLEEIDQRLAEQEPPRGPETRGMRNKRYDAEQVADDAKKPKVGLSWRPVDLAAILADGYEPPTPSVATIDGLDTGLFYPGRINSVFGDSGGGKTWLILMVIAQLILTGKDVLFIDYEDHPAAAVHRLTQLGVPEELILAHFIYINPDEAWGLLAREELKSGLDGRHPVIAALDSTGESMAVDGVNPNADEEVARWFRALPKALAGEGYGVVLADHVPKGSGTGRNTDFGIGSQRKRAAVNGAAYYLEVIKAPSKQDDGLFKLVARKDRFGTYTHGHTVCTVDMKNRDDGTIDWSISVPDEAPKPGADEWVPTGYMETVSQYLEVHDPERVGFSMSRINESVTGKKQYLVQAVDALVARGHCVDRGNGSARKIVFLTPFREEPATTPAGDPDEPF